MKPARIVTAIAAAALLTLGGSAMAQQGHSGSQSGQGYRMPPASSSHFSDAQLKKFATASKQINKIRKEYSGKLQGVQDKNKARQLQQEAAKKMTRAVQNAGLKVRTYNKIAAQINRDPDLRQRVMNTQG